MSKKTGHKRCNQGSSLHLALALQEATMTMWAWTATYNRTMRRIFQLYRLLQLSRLSPPKKQKTSISHSRQEHSLGSDDAVRSLADLINRRSDALEKMMESVHGEIKALDKKVSHIEGRLEGAQSTALKTSTRVSELERYSQWWNLRLHGLKETTEEDGRAQVVSVCLAILSEEKTKLPDFIDVAHWVGKPRQDDTKPQGVIMRFTARRFRDAVWKAAKNNSFLQNKGLRFTEDLTQEGRENRQKLWLTIKKAREEGKTAYFVGERGFVSGAEILV